MKRALDPGGRGGARRKRHPHPLTTHILNPLGFRVNRNPARARRGFFFTLDSRNLDVGALPSSSSRGPAPVACNVRPSATLADGFGSCLALVRLKQVPSNCSAAPRKLRWCHGSHETRNAREWPGRGFRRLCRKQHAARTRKQETRLLPRSSLDLFFFCESFLRLAGKRSPQI